MWMRFRNYYKYYKQQWWWIRLYTELYCQCVFLKSDNISHLLGPCLCLCMLYQHIWTQTSHGVFEAVMRQKAADGWSWGLSYRSLVVTHEVHRPFEQRELCRWSCWQTEIAFTELESQGHRQLYIWFLIFFLRYQTFVLLENYHFLSHVHGSHINLLPPRLPVCCVSDVLSPRSHRWEEGERLMDFTRFVVILLAVWLLRGKLLNPCMRTRVCVRACAWWWRRDRSTAGDVMVTGCQALYILALVVLLHLMEFTLTASNWSWFFFKNSICIYQNNRNG